MRLFVAFAIPMSLGEELARGARPPGHELPSARWIPAPNLHLTLAFLGEVEAADQPALERALATAFRPWPPLACRWTELGAFPPRGSARILWAGLTTDGDLAGLQQAVAAAAARSLGREAERRPFHPHITVARCRPSWRRSPVDRWRSAASLPIAGFRAEQGSLYESELRPSGARYRQLASFPLEGPT